MAIDLEAKVEEFWDQLENADITSSTRIDLILDLWSVPDNGPLESVAVPVFADLGSSGYSFDEISKNVSNAIRPYADKPLLFEIRDVKLEISSGH